LIFEVEVEVWDRISLRSKFVAEINKYVVVSKEVGPEATGHTFISTIFAIVAWSS